MLARAAVAAARRGLLPRALTGGIADVPTPTADLYFAHAFRDEIEAGRTSSGTLLKRRGANAFEWSSADDRGFIVLRRCEPALLDEIERARRDGPVRLTTLLDDDVWAIERDRNVPLGYRTRSWFARQIVVERALALSDAVVATSDVLMDTLSVHAPRTAVHRVDPCLLRPPAPLDHHENGPLEILLADTRSHDADAAAAAPSIAAFLEGAPEARLTTFLGDRAPSCLRRGGVTHLSPLSWPAFRQWSERRRFHVLIAPREPTPVNQARSLTRLLDAATFGAVGLFGANDAIEEALDRGGLPDWTFGHVEWTQALARLSDRPDLRRQLAERTASVAAELGAVSRQKAVWTEIVPQLA